MKIGIDARFYGPIGKGLGRYTQEIIDNIILINNNQNESHFNFVIFLSPDNFDELIIQDSRVKKVLIDIPWYSWKEQLLFPWYIWKEKLDLMHFPHFNIPIFAPVKFVMTLHDLILTHFPTMRATTKSKVVYYFKNFAYRLVLRMAIFRSQKIIAVSKFTKQDIIHKFKIDEKKIEVTYEGIANLRKGRDSLFVAKLNPDEILEHYHLGKNFLLYVGNAYPHKNLSTLLKVFSNLYQKNQDLKLVLVGKEDYFYRQIKDHAKSLNLWQPNNVNNPVVFPGYVPDSQLELLYQKAKLYIFPSLYEGFGLPPLEAMANGCPVLSSDRASLPEVLGSAAIYFNPEDENDILTKIIKVLQDENLQDNLKVNGLKQVKLYNWWECANQTLKIYNLVLSPSNYARH